MRVGGKRRTADRSVGGSERDTRVELVSQPWEGWAQPIYQSRASGNSNIARLASKPLSLIPNLPRFGEYAFRFCNREDRRFTPLPRLCGGEVDGTMRMHRHVGGG